MRVPCALFALTSVVLALHGEKVGSAHQTHHHTHGHRHHHGHQHHHRQYEPEQTRSAKAALDARAAANEANEVAIKSVGVTEHAQSALKVARNALRDARASSGGLSGNQKTLLKEAEGQLRDAALSAEYGKLQQAEWLKAKGHFIATKETSLKKLEDRMSTKSVTSSNAELESLRLEIAQLKAALDAKTLEKNVKYVDNAGTATMSDDKSNSAIRDELDQLEGMIQSLEAAEANHKTNSDGPSHDELKAETERLRASIDHLEAQQIPASSDLDILKIRVRELERERDLRAQELELQRQLEIARTQKQITEEAKMHREMEILTARKHILEKELSQSHSPTEESMLSEIQTLHRQIDALEHPKADTGTLVYEIPRKKQLPLGELSADEESATSEGEANGNAVDSPPNEDSPGETPVHESGIDIDTAMPYGELEPFGREDTAQELTEDSVRESDEMVDQLERAEVAEEKRAVFRALTRLRGAAITSFDGIARSQTGNIDEYNKLHKWRRTHPLHHLADEESDISKWAFPDNADF